MLGGALYCDFAIEPRKVNQKIWIEREREKKEETKSAYSFLRSLVSKKDRRRQL